MLFLTIGCATRSVKLDENIEQIPPEIALDYLQTESAKYSESFRCLYTKYGVKGIPYPELDVTIQQNMWGNWQVIMWRKGKAHTYTPLGVENTAWVCHPFFMGGMDGKDYTPEEIEHHLKKTVSAIVSLGVEIVE